MDDRNSTDRVIARVSPFDLLGPLSDVELHNAPEFLYIAGDPALAQRSPRVAVVGARKASPLGIRRAEKLARLLVEHGAVVVSGLAEGIDTAAHSAAIEAGGQTIAVLGTSLDQVYPRANRRLQQTIMSDHLAISQFPSGTPIQRFHFPLRNRVMALISDASIIVEAGETSGSKSQAWEALRLGRPLFLLKSLVDQPGLSWPKEMLEHGAQVISDPDDLGEFLEPYFPRGEGDLVSATL